MEKRYILALDQGTVESGQTAVVAINGDTATCERVLWDENGRIFLLSLNQAYDPRYCTAIEINQIPVTIMKIVFELRC